MVTENKSGTCQSESAPISALKGPITAQSPARDAAASLLLCTPIQFHQHPFSHQLLPWATSSRTNWSRDRQWGTNRPWVTTWMEQQEWKASVSPWLTCDRGCYNLWKALAHLAAHLPVRCSFSFSPLSANPTPTTLISPPAFLILAFILHIYSLLPCNSISFVIVAQDEKC